MVTPIVKLKGKLINMGNIFLIKISLTEKAFMQAGLYTS